MSGTARRKNNPSFRKKRVEPPASKEYRKRNEPAVDDLEDFWPVPDQVDEDEPKQEVEL